MQNIRGLQQHSGFVIIRRPDTLPRPMRLCQTQNPPQTPRTFLKIIITFLYVNNSRNGDIRRRIIGLEQWLMWRGLQ